MRKLTTCLALSLALGVQAQQHVMTVDASKPTAQIQPEMYGIFLKISISVQTADSTPNW